MTRLPCTAALLLTGAALLHCTEAFFYRRPSVPKCPVYQEVKFYDETIHAKEIGLVPELVNLPVYNFKTVYETTVVPTTSYVFQTVTEVPIQVQVTETHVVTTVVDIPLTKVRTWTTNVVDTVVQIFTDTATNYLSAFDTVTLRSTHLVDATEVNTVFADSTETVVQPLKSTVFVTSFVTENEADGANAKTVYLPNQGQFTSTHTVTKMITNTYCPLPLEAH